MAFRHGGEEFVQSRALRVTAQSGSRLAPAKGEGCDRVVMTKPLEA
jgi:hypothetical protein